GAISRIAGEEPIEIMDAVGESIPLSDASIDVVYARQVLHHAPDPDAIGLEVARVLRPGGRFLASREHVVRDEEELRTFLDEHPAPRRAGGEGAPFLADYLSGMSQDGLHLLRVWGHFDSILNAYPAVNSNEELRDFRRQALGGWLARLGRLGTR